MPKPVLPDAEFIELFESIGPGPMGRRLGMDIRSIYSRRASIEKRINRPLVSPNPHCATRRPNEYPGRLHIGIQNGQALVGGDCHYWPDIITTAHRAFVKFSRELKPQAVIINGDAFDGARISRHPPIGWEKTPSVIDELDACKQRLGEIDDANKSAKERIWNLGNHDARFETRLATVAPEYARVNGFHLRDHFPRWECAWSTFINDDVVVKHRFKGGIHAAHNNTMWAGKSIVTNHLHSPKVTPFSDYNGTRFGVDTGTMADPYGPQFEYQEDNARNHRSAFGVLTFWKGRLLWPEIVHVIAEGSVEFRGKVYEV